MRARAKRFSHGKSKRVQVGRLDAAKGGDSHVAAKEMNRVIHGRSLLPCGIPKVPADGCSNGEKLETGTNWERKGNGQPMGGTLSLASRYNLSLRGSHVACLDRVDDRSDLNFDACLERRLSHRYFTSKVGVWAAVAKALRPLPPLKIRESNPFKVRPDARLFLLQDEITSRATAQPLPS